MKRITAILMMCVLPAVLPAVETSPNAQEDAKAYLDLLRQIGELQKDISSYYTDLNDRSRVWRAKDANGNPTGPAFSEFEIQAETQTYYGQRDRYVYTEKVRIEWGDAAQGTPSINKVTVTQRRGRIGQSYVLRRQLNADVLPQVKSEAEPLPIVMVVNELLDSGKGMFVNFRMPPDDKARDGEETITVDGQKKTVKVIYMRSHAEKMRILREYRDVLKLTWRRVDWEIRSQKARNAADLERILRRPSDF